MYMKNNENKDICSLCKGACCKRSSGIVNPNQLGEITVDKIREYLNNGYQFDYWEDNPTNDPKYNNKRAYYLRPQHTNSINKKVDPSWGGTCVFLTDTGCSKEFSDRPEQCQKLIPNKTFSCDYDKSDLTKQDYVILWLEHNDIIKEALED